MIVKKGKSCLLLKHAINKKNKDQRKNEENGKSELLETISDIQKEITSLKKRLIDKDRHRFLLKW